MGHLQESVELCPLVFPQSSHAIFEGLEPNGGQHSAMCVAIFVLHFETDELTHLKYLQSSVIRRRIFFFLHLTVWV